MAATTYNYGRSPKEVETGIVSAGLAPSSVTQPGAVAATFTAPLSADEQAGLDQAMSDMGYVFLGVTDEQPGGNVGSAPGEGTLTLVRGRLDTTAPDVLDGSGWAVGRNSTGDVTIKYLAVFRDVPAVVVAAEAAAGSSAWVTVADSDEASARLRRVDGAGTPEDGIVSFLAVGLFP